MSRASAIIADDEINVARHLQKLLQDSWKELDIIAIAQAGDTALSLIKEYSPDIVFLDIRMPGLSGLEVASRLPQNTYIVFVTAYDEYATQAFEQAAIDYLLKPVTLERLQSTIVRLQARVSANYASDPEVLRKILEQLQHKQPDYLQWLRVGKGEVVELIPMHKVVYLKAGGKYTSIVTADREHLIRMPIRELEASLDPDKFWRIHRGTLVNVSEIARAQRDFRGRYHVDLRNRTETLLVSQPFNHLFKNM